MLLNFNGKRIEIEIEKIYTNLWNSEVEIEVEDESNVLKVITLLYNFERKRVSRSILEMIKDEGVRDLLESLEMKNIFYVKIYEKINYFHIMPYRQYCKNLVDLYKFLLDNGFIAVQTYHMGDKINSFDDLINNIGECDVIYINKKFLK